MSILRMGHVMVYFNGTAVIAAWWLDIQSVTILRVSIGMIWFCILNNLLPAPSSGHESALILKDFVHLQITTEIPNVTK